MLILAEGGLTTHWAEIRPAMGLGVALATLGVGVSVAVVAVGSHYLLGLDWELAFLLGAVTSPTDAAAVFSVLRRVPLPPGSPAPSRRSPVSTTPHGAARHAGQHRRGLEHGVLGFGGIVVYELVAGACAASRSASAARG